MTICISALVIKISCILDECIYMMDMSSEEFKDYFHLAYGYTKAMNFKTSAYIGLKVLARAYKEESLMRMMYATL